eukprot:m.228796 g.228796  ORF g.228796 m.228796 type:complete len:516 (-) comp11791_c0_seq1:56-1603(-)
MLYTFLYTGTLPYCRLVLDIDSTRYQTFRTVALSPWSMKAFFGVVSDTVPLFGYYKKYYIFIGSSLAVAAFAILATMPLTASAADFAAMLFFLGNMAVVVVDLLCEGRYAELMVEKPYTGSDLVSYIWGVYQIGQLLVSGVVGPMADAGYARGMFYICVPLAAQILVPTGLNYLGEKQLPPAERRIRVDKIKAHKGIFTLASAMALAAVILIPVSMFAGDTAVLVYALLSSAAMCALGFAVLPRMLAQCNLYMFLVSAMYIQIDGALDYFYTSDNECVPDGPDFSFTFYNTWSQIVQAIFGGIGVVLFQTWMNGWRFRRLFWVPTLLRVAASLVDIFIVKRWNKAIGMSDESAYMLGYNIIYQVAYMMEFMPAVILTSKLCPKGIEATMYALLAGFQNFGQGIALSLGRVFMGALHIESQAPCDFTRLPLLIVICHFIFPLATIPLTFFLIPDSKMTDDLIDGASPAAAPGTYAPVRLDDDPDDLPLISGADADAAFQMTDMAVEGTLADVALTD